MHARMHAQARADEYGNELRKWIQCDERDDDALRLRTMRTHTDRWQHVSDYNLSHNKISVI